MKCSNGFTAEAYRLSQSNLNMVFRSMYQAIHNSVRPTYLSTHIRDTRVDVHVHFEFLLCYIYCVKMFYSGKNEILFV